MRTKNRVVRAGAPVLAAAGLALGLVVGTAGSASAGITDGRWHLKNVHSGKCLVIQGSTVGDTPGQYDCASFQDQVWLIMGPALPVGYNGIDGVYKLYNTNSKLYLSASGPDNGNPIVQVPGSQDLTQWWSVKQRGGDFQFKNAATGRCMVIQGYDNWSRAFQYDCSDVWDDQWWQQT
ncbi:RICIN domain-containing protein [Kitasatospora sp. NPDC101183]|uniref:RICIN domain-containing protein n=1 Tax=Kitasatospora sp. NPDC101183 TaxID=3364100 RepID=UPI0038069279